VPYVRNPGVDEYIAGLPSWQQDVCRRVRDLVHEADPDVTEVIKRSVQPYFVLQGNVCALLAARDHVNVFLYDGGLVADPAGIITHGHQNTTARQISITPDRPVDEAALLTMLRAIIADNRAGGWRTLKRDRSAR